MRSAVLGNARAYQRSSPFSPMRKVLSARMKSYRCHGTMSSPPEEREEVSKEEFNARFEAAKQRFGLK